MGHVSVGQTSPTVVKGMVSLFQTNPTAAVMHRHISLYPWMSLAALTGHYDL